MAHLGTIMMYLKQIDLAIAQLRKKMAHAHPYSVDALRHTLEEIEAIRRVLLRSELQSGANLEKLLEKIKACIRTCIRPEYSGKQEVLGYPSYEYWRPPVTSTGVNIIFMVDISHSMFRSGGLEPGGRIRRVLVDFSREMETRALAAGIPCKVSLIWYADPTDQHGQNRPIFWDVALNKVSDINRLATAFTHVNLGKWAVGADLPESGMSAIYHSIDSVFDQSVVNNKPVENSLILVSDERQKLHGGNPGSHPNYREVTFQDVQSKCDRLGLKNRYALFPINNGQNNQTIPFFRQVREITAVQSANDLSDWLTWTLDPTLAP